MVMFLPVEFSLSGLHFFSTPSSSDIVQAIKQAQTMDAEYHPTRREHPKTIKAHKKSPKSRHSGTLVRRTRPYLLWFKIGDWKVPVVISLLPCIFWFSYYKILFRRNNSDGPSQPLYLIRLGVVCALSCTLKPYSSHQCKRIFSQRLPNFQNRPCEIFLFNFHVNEPLKDYPSLTSKFCWFVWWYLFHQEFLHVIIRIYFTNNPCSNHFKAWPHFTPSSLFSIAPFYSGIVF